MLIQQSRDRSTSVGGRIPFPIADPSRSRPASAHQRQATSTSAATSDPTSDISIATFESDMIKSIEQFADVIGDHE